LRLGLGEDVLHRQTTGDTDQNPEAGIAEGLTAETARGEIVIPFRSGSGVSGEILRAGIGIEDLSHIIDAWT